MYIYYFKNQLIKLVFNFNIFLSLILNLYLLYEFIFFFLFLNFIHTLVLYQLYSTEKHAGMHNVINPKRVKANVFILIMINFFI